MSSEDDARKRLEGRFAEFLSTEKSLLNGIAELVEHLDEVLSNPKWKFKAEQSGLISRTSQAAKNVGALHREMAEVLLLGGNNVGALPQTFEALEGKFEGEYTVYQLVASHAILVLQKLSGGQVGFPPSMLLAFRAVRGLFLASNLIAFADSLPCRLASAGEGGQRSRIGWGALGTGGIGRPGVRCPGAAVAANAAYHAVPAVHGGDGARRRERAGF